MNDPLKPGVKTSEFWVMIVTQVLGLLVLSGHLSASTAADLTQPITNIIGGVLMIVTAVAYIYSRTKIKSEVIKSSVVTDVPAETPTVTPTVVTETPAVTP